MTFEEIQNHPNITWKHVPNGSLPFFNYEKKILVEEWYLTDRERAVLIDKFIQIVEYVLQQDGIVTIYHRRPKGDLVFQHPNKSSFWYILAGIAGNKPYVHNTLGELVATA